MRQRTQISDDSIELVFVVQINARVNGEHFQLGRERVDLAVFQCEQLFELLDFDGEYLCGLSARSGSSKHGGHTSTVSERCAIVASLSAIIPL